MLCIYDKKNVMISDQLKIIREISQHGLSATFSCDPDILDYERHGYLQGVLYMGGNDDSFMFKKVSIKLHHRLKVLHP